jgi:hypothetical protein
VTALTFENAYSVVHVDSAETVITKCLLIATGADYRRLTAEGCAPVRSNASPPPRRGRNGRQIRSRVLEGHVNERVTIGAKRQAEVSSNSLNDSIGRRHP